MELWLWLAIGVLSLCVLVLAVRLHLMHRAADEIGRAFAQRLEDDTNTLIDLSSRDRHLRALAAQLNGELRKLRRQRQRYQQGDAELKEAVTAIAHDLRTPLTAISGYLQLLKREDTPPAVTRYLGLIQNRTQALTALTEELFRYSVLISEQELKRERVVLNDVLEESLAAAYSVLTQRGISPSIAIADEKTARVLDRTALSRVFENVISNAVKYSDGDFAVTLDDRGIITFSNTARKLDSVAVGRLFDRFYTLETGRSSTGLGLAIAKSLTERMGGRITADYQAEQLIITVCFS